MQLTDIFPAIPKVARLITITPTETGDDDLDFWIWFRSLQGLANRVEPHLYIIRPDASTKKRPRKHYQEHWLDYYTKTFGIPHTSMDDVDEVIESYKSLVEGYVVYDMDVLQTSNIAVTRCGLESLLPIAPHQEEWMIRHGIPKRDDLRGKFGDDWKAAKWAVENLWPHTYKKIYANFCIHRPEWTTKSQELQDFVVRNKVFACDLPASRQRRDVLNLYRRMLDSGDAPGVQMNWHCIFDQEKEYVAEAAQRGYFSLCSMNTPNLTIHGGVGDPDMAHTQPMPDPEECKAESDKTYVCLYNSDGDATWAVNNLQSGNWIAENRGKFKFGWGFLPLSVKLAPAQLQYYHETKTENDCFWGPSSGAGYTYSFLWPEHLREMYLSESRQLLDQSGQNGCNMVNWHLQDWWREVDDPEAIAREQEFLKSGPGLVCGLGGSPYAKSYLDGPIPKIHSVHIANVGRNTARDIISFNQECPTQPKFMFLFAQINPGIWEQIESELDEYAAHPEIVLLTMDEFFLTLKDAMGRGMVGDTLYEQTPEMEERWLKRPGRNRLPICERLTLELATVANADQAERGRHLAEALWTDLVSKEVEGTARDRERFLTGYKGRTPFTPEEDADALLYTAFTVAWIVVRAAIQSQGIYANHRIQCLDDFKRTCGEIVDVAPFDALFDAWGKWEDGVPEVATMAKWCEGLATGAQQLRAALGPDESDDAFESWPPPSI